MSGIGGSCIRSLFIAGEAFYCWNYDPECTYTELNGGLIDVNDGSYH
jgi:hypothetical protein